MNACSPRPLVCLAAFSLAFAPLAAQRPTADSTASEAIRDLADPDRQLLAAKRLVRMGASVVPLLVAAMERERSSRDQGRYLMTIFTLAKLGEQAHASTRTIMDHLDGADAVAERQLLWAVGRIGPAALQSNPGLVRSLEDLQVRAGSSSQWWNIARARLALGTDPSEAQIVEQLRGPGFQNSIAGAMAMRSAETSTPATRAALLDAHGIWIANWRRWGDSYLPAVFAMSSAMVRCCDGDTSAVLRSHAYLLLHFDAEVRQRSAVGLRRYRKLPRDVKPFLLASLEDGNPQVLRESITTVGLLEQPMLRAVPALLTHRTNRNKAIAAVARDALRRIRRHLSETACLIVDHLATASASRRSELEVELVKRSGDAVSCAMEILEWTVTRPTLGEVSDTLLRMLPQFGRDARYTRPRLRAWAQQPGLSCAPAAAEALQKLDT